MTVYLDTSVLVALLTPETLSIRAEEFVASNREPLLVSDLASAEPFRGGYGYARARSMRRAPTRLISIFG